MVNCFEPLEGELSFGEQVTKDAYYALFRLADHLKQGNVKMNFSKLNRVAFLDSLCDQMVTTIGIAHMLQMDIAGGFEEVNQSNWSKFDEHGIPIFNENKKIMKGPNYRKPTLDPFV
jgi:predicted HAD superfamily Cof-like phosphohydrolase